MKRFALAAALLFLTVPAAAQNVTELLRSGANGSKLNLVIIGDGFAAANQNAYNTFVTNTVIRGIFNESVTGADDFYPAAMNAFNIFRVNANSQQSGITTVDANGNVTNTVNTFLGYRFSGNWNRCWMEPGPTSNTTLNNTLDQLVPGWDYAFIILNTTSFGGCRRGNTLAITMGSAATTGMHEMGHMVGNLGDEYTGTAAYTGSDPGIINLTTATTRATLKWNAFVNPSTPIPTNAGTFTGSTSDDAGLFAGGTFSGTRYQSGISRPAVNCRMNGNAPPFCPICYNQIQESVDGRHEYVYRNVYTGRFKKGNTDSVMVHNANSIALYNGVNDEVDPAWVRTLPDPVWDAYRAGDRFFVGDFDGDGIQDLFVFNIADWSMPYFAMLRGTGTGFEGVRRFDRDLPGWGEMRAHDEFFVGDFDGDRKTDIAVFNGQDWAVAYLLILRSTGNDLTFVRRFDDQLPGWDSMKRNDKFHVADFDADGRDDFYVTNMTDWSMGYLMMLRSTGSDLVSVRRFDDQLPGWDSMKANDQFYVADFDNDRRKDLYVFNGPDWSMPYLEMLRSTGTTMTATRRFDRDVPGWGEMRRRDRWYVADVNGDGRHDLYVYNGQDWSTEYLGTLTSSGGNLGGGWQDDWIGSWNLGSVDQFRVINFNGGSGWQDLVVFNDNWLGLLRSRASALSLSAIYPKWIHNHRFHNLGWW
jgi:hypothetical protein